MIQVPLLLATKVCYDDSGFFVGVLYTTLFTKDIEGFDLSNNAASDLLTKIKSNNVKSLVNTQDPNLLDENGYTAYQNSLNKPYFK